VGRQRSLARHRRRRIVRGFPDVYATVFSGFLSRLRAVLVALIFSRRWPSSFAANSRCAGAADVGYRVQRGQHCVSLLIGVAMGNIAWGVPIDARANLPGTLLSVCSSRIRNARGHYGGAVHDAWRDYALMKTEGPYTTNCAAGSSRHHFLIIATR